MIKPKLSLFNIVMIIISLVIGVGIFRTPASVAKTAGSPEIFYTAWIIGGLIALCGALTFAEIGSRMPVAGGFYKLFSYSYHPAYAFMLNWAQVIINAASSAAVGLIGAQYISPVLLPIKYQNEQSQQIIVIGIVLVLFTFNFLGIRSGARTQNILSSLKIILMLVFCSGLFLAPENRTSAAPVISHDSLLAAIGLSLVPVFFTFGGYQNTVNFGADVNQPKKNIPRGIFIGVILISTLYLCINMTYVRVLGFAHMQQSDLVAADMAERIFGNIGARFASVTIFISVLGFVNTALLYNPRIYYAMAEERTLPAIFGKVHDKTQVQEFALVFFTCLIIISAIIFKNFDRIVNYVMFIDTIALASAGASIFIFRKKAGRRDPHNGFKIKFYPLIPAVFMLALILVNINVVCSDPENSLIGLCILLAGYPLFRIMQKINSKQQNPPH